MEDNKLQYLGQIISMINCEEYDASIVKLASDCKVSIQYMRNTFVKMLENNILKACLFDGEENINDVDTLMDMYFENPVQAKSDILSGIYDETKWHIDLKVLDRDKSEIIPLGHIEYGILDLLEDNPFSEGRKSIFERKDMVSWITPKIKRYHQFIQTAIDNNRAISFKYKNSFSEDEEIVCYPREIIINTTDHWIYFISDESIIYRLDRILHMDKKFFDKENKKENYKQNLNRKYIWGISDNGEKNPVHVKLRISPETSNII